MCSRGEIWLADPVLIVQSQVLLDAGHPSTYVMPLTTKLMERAEPLRIRVPASGGLPKDSDVLVDQMRAVDNRRLVKGPLLRLSGRDMKRVTDALQELIGVR
jgi:mRNA interferase MazF